MYGNHNLQSFKRATSVWLIFLEKKESQERHTSYTKFSVLTLYISELSTLCLFCKLEASETWFIIIKSPELWNSNFSANVFLNNYKTRGLPFFSNQILNFDSLYPRSTSCITCFCFNFSKGILGELSETNLTFFPKSLKWTQLCTGTFLRLSSNCVVVTGIRREDGKIIPSAIKMF